MEFHCSSQTSHILRVLRQQQIDGGHYCDVTIRPTQSSLQSFTTSLVDDIRAHRCILAASSDYFRALFDTRLGNSELSIHEIHTTSPACLRHVIEFMYTGDINITGDDVTETLRLADYLSVPSLVSFCGEFLRQHLDDTNCLRMMFLVDAYNLTSVTDDVIDYVTSRWSTLIGGDEINQLPMRAVRELLSADGETGFAREEDELDAVCRYARFASGRAEQPDEMNPPGVTCTLSYNYPSVRKEPLQISGEYLRVAKALEVAPDTRIISIRDDVSGSTDVDADGANKPTLILNGNEELAAQHSTNRNKATDASPLNGNKRKNQRFGIENSNVGDMDVEYLVGQYDTDVLQFDRCLLTLDLLDCVDFRYLTDGVLSTKVLSSPDIVQWLSLHKPDVLQDISNRVATSQNRRRDVCDVIFVRSRILTAENEIRILLYVIDDDEWLVLKTHGVSLVVQTEKLQEDGAGICTGSITDRCGKLGPGALDAGLGTHISTLGMVEPAVELSLLRSDISLSGLESMAFHSGSLYLLCSTTEDLKGYFHSSRELKRFYRLRLTTLSGSSEEPAVGGMGEWELIPSPPTVRGPCRLVETIDALCIIDRSGVIDVYHDVSLPVVLDSQEQLCSGAFRVGLNRGGRWSAYDDGDVGTNGVGFGGSRGDSTLCILPMSIDRRLYLLRTITSGHSFEFAQKSFELYVCHSPSKSRRWDLISEIEAADVFNNMPSSSSLATSSFSNSSIVTTSSRACSSTSRDVRREKQDKEERGKSLEKRNEDINLFGYSIVPGLIMFKDELDNKRAVFELSTGHWSSCESPVRYPRCWLGRDVYGSATCADRVYCSVGAHVRGSCRCQGATREPGAMFETGKSATTSNHDIRYDCQRNSFWMFDKSNNRFKLTAQPPISLSGFLCHVTLRRSTLEAIASVYSARKSATEG